MKRQAAAVLVVSIVAWAGLSAVAKLSPRIVELRYAAHPDYDRLVVQIAGDLEVFHQPFRVGEPFVLELNARPKLPDRVIQTSLQRLGRIRIQGAGDGARLLIQARTSRIRSFLLQNPTRLVIDFGAPGNSPFPIPPGTERVLEAVAPPEPVALLDEAIGPVIESETVEAELVEPELAAVEPAPAPTPAPVLEPQVHRPRPRDPLVEPDRQPAEQLAESVPSVGDSPGSRAMEPGAREQSVQIALGGLFLALLGAAAWFALRVWRRMPAEATSAGVVARAILEGPVETITVADLSRGSTDRTGILERRLDDEVRARMQVEERVIQLQEELKIVRDRLHRVSRREGGGSAR
jgi:hypothetical protein